MPRTPSEARTRWDAFFSAYNDITKLRDATKTESSEEDDDRAIAGLKSVVWKALLLYKTLDVTEWKARLENERREFERLREEFLVTRFPGEEDEDGLDPLLADEESNPWVLDAQNEAIRAEILQDVDRCMPENPYFRLATTQEAMVDVLFIWCKLHPEIGYRQGMHELVAPILWVVDEDSQPAAADEPWSSVLDKDYVRHDTFTLFRKIMTHAAKWYESGSSNSNGSIGDSTIIGLSDKIHKELLHSVDPELADCLTRLEVLPQVFLIRWIRLLFGREFPFEQCLEFWDCLFAVSPELELVPYICVAMLIRVRWQILSSSYSDAFTTLLRYPSPSPHHPKTFILDALTLSTSPTTEAAAAIIQHYTKRRPNPYSSSAAPSSTSSGGPRKRPTSGPHRRKGPASIPVPSSLKLDSLFIAANNVLDRSPGQTFTRAVGKAVDEARRRGLAVAAGPPSLLSPRGAISPFDEASDSERSIGGMALSRRGHSISRGQSEDTTDREEKVARELEKAMDLLKDVISTLPMLDANREKLDDALGIIQGLPLPYHIITPTATSRVSSPPPAAHTTSSSTTTTNGTSTPLVVTPAPIAQMSSFPMGGLSTSSPTHKKKERASLANSEFSWMLGDVETGSGLKFKKKGSKKTDGDVDLGWLGGS